MPKLLPKFLPQLLPKFLSKFLSKFYGELFLWLRAELRFFLPFALVGTGGFLVDALCLTLLIELFTPSGVVETLFLRCFGFSFGVFFTWFCNKNWTFREQRDSGSLLLYYPLMAFGSLINLGSFTLCLLWLPLATRYPVIAIAFGTGLAMFVNFASMRLLVFRQRGEQQGG